MHKGSRRVLIFSLLGSLFLAGCGAFGQATPQALPTVVLDSGSQASPSASPAAGGAAPSLGGGGATASGNVVPAQQAQLASNIGGIVKSVNVAVGDPVKAGQVLISLAGSEKLAASVQAASLELLTAQQALDNFNANAALAEAQAEQAVEAAKKAVDDADKRVGSLSTHASQADIDAAYAAMILAKDQLDKARDDYDPFRNKSEDNTVRAMLLSRLAGAQKAYDASVTRYNNVKGIANELDLNLAKSNLLLAQAQLADAQQNYNKVKDGPDPDALKLAQARVENAKAQLAAGQASLVDLELRAPFEGTVSKINLHSGEWAMPGQPILALADLGHLQVETTDLSERDIPKVKVDQPVTVYVKALNQNVPGRVIEISPLADTLGGDVVYKTIIELDSLPAGLRAGMSVEVQFGTG